MLNIVGWVFGIAQLLLMFMLMVLAVIGGRDLRKQKKYGWLSLGLFVIAAYILLTIVGQVISLVVSG